MKWLLLFLLLLMYSCSQLISQQPIVDPILQATTPRDSVYTYPAQTITRAQLWAQWGVFPYLQQKADSMKNLFSLYLLDTTNKVALSQMDSLVLLFPSESLIRLYAESFCDLADTMELVQRYESTEQNIENSSHGWDSLFLSSQGDSLAWSSSLVIQSSGGGEDDALVVVEEPALDERFSVISASLPCQAIPAHLCPQLVGLTTHSRYDQALDS